MKTNKNNNNNKKTEKLRRGLTHKKKNISRLKINDTQAKIFKK